MNPTQTPTTTAAVTPADVLDAAAEHIERHGFHKGSYYHDTFAHCPAACAAGAIAIAAHGEPVLNPDCHPNPASHLYTQTLGWLQTYLDANLDRHQGEPIGVYAYNDSPDTTGVDVIDMMRAAAAAWRTESARGERS